MIMDIELDWSTHRREAQGSDNFQLTWADDDNLYGAWGDGGGFGGANDDGRDSLGFARIEGGWNTYRGYNVWGGKNAENPPQFPGKSWGTICVGGVLYSWIVPDNPDAAGSGDGFRFTDDPAVAWPRDHYRYVHLARSKDHGATWERAPWRWWREDNLIVATFLNHGRDDDGARDEFVYSYFLRPERTDVTQSEFKLNVHKPGALFLARVHRDHIFAGRDAYEWFGGVVKGKPAWGPLASKQPVFENPEGTGWCVSAIHNRALGRYFLATEHGVSERGSLGLYDAPAPWGPWTTVKYWTAAHPFGQTRPGSALEWKDNIFFFSFVPKWWGADGREFTLLFTGAGKGQDNDSLNTVRGRFIMRKPPAPPPPEKTPDGPAGP
ncbi:DUF4185 domain-containing protein [Termitidicoccus mucosus]